jgi:hypothetical protein
MATRFTGGCICGGVRYECAADLIAAGIATAVIASAHQAAPMLQLCLYRPAL